MVCKGTKNIRYRQIDVRFFVFFLDITYIFAMSLMKKDKKHAKHISVDKIRHINRFCLHMSEKYSTFVGGKRNTSRNEKYS